MLEARILEWARRGPQDGATHWPPVGHSAGHQSHDRFAGLGPTRPAASPIAPLHAEKLSRLREEGDRHYRPLLNPPVKKLSLELGRQDPFIVFNASPTIEAYTLTQL